MRDGLLLYRALSVLARVATYYSTNLTRKTRNFSNKHASFLAIALARRGGETATVLRFQLLDVRPSTRYSLHRPDSGVIYDFITTPGSQLCLSSSCGSTAGSQL